MNAPMSQERLAEIRQADKKLYFVSEMTPSEWDRRKLLAEVDRQAAEIADLRAELERARPVLTIVRQYKKGLCTVSRLVHEVTQWRGGGEQ